MHTPAPPAPPHAAEHRQPDRGAASSSAPASPRRCSRCHRTIQLRTLRGPERRAVACDLQTACILPEDAPQGDDILAIVHGGQLRRGRRVKPGTPRAVVGPLLHACPCPRSTPTQEHPR